MLNYLLDDDFLDKLNHYQHKEIYARIISLNFNEQPIEQIEGKITGGSISCDGNSSVRRTCSLSMVAKDININEFHWGITNKFKLEIGVNNLIDSNYPEVIWFKQGVFVITSFNIALSSGNYTISINGKDKMCLLNGDIGGSLPASIDFGKIDNYSATYIDAQITEKSQYQSGKYYIYSMEQGNFILDNAEGPPPTKLDENGKEILSKKYYIKNDLLNQEDLLIKDIIREAVRVYGKEMYHNIIINDLDEYGLELLEYRGDEPLYLLFDEEASIYNQMATEDTAKRLDVYKNSDLTESFKLIDCQVFNSAVDNLNSNRTIFYIETERGIQSYSCTKMEYGATAGYRITDLVYAGELISSIGESLTSILDKIIGMLGPFEYFYDVDGRFVFQAKKIYAKNSWSPIVQTNNEYHVKDAVEESPYSYSFEDLKLIQTFQNTPTINNLKNDYSIWGTRKSASGAEIPIHARYAIQEKPKYYKNYNEEIYSISDYDWREILYQMAVDYYKHNQEQDFLYKVMLNNYVINEEYPNGYYLYPEGRTGYEMFYEDIQGFWRQLYDPNPTLDYDTIGGYYSEEKQYEVDENGEELPTYRIIEVWNPFTELENFTCDYYLKPSNNEEYSDIENYSPDYYYWNKNVERAPELLNFWIDFYEGEDLMKYNISNIGDRQKVINNSKITSVYFRNIPKVIFIDTDTDNYDSDKMASGYYYIQLDDSMENLFTISAQGKSAEEEMEELLNTYSYCSEGISITTIPIYHLEPNTLIHLHNEETNINGKYQINKINIPLAYNGVMNITATKIIDQVY